LEQILVCLFACLFVWFFFALLVVIVVTLTADQKEWGLIPTQANLCKMKLFSLCYCSGGSELFGPHYFLFSQDDCQTSATKSPMMGADVKP
jgi:hypothetical protein